MTFNDVSRKTLHGNKIVERVYEFEGQTIRIPLRRAGTVEATTVLTPTQTQKLAETYHALNKALAACYGKNEIASVDGYTQGQGYYYHSLDSIFKNLSKVVSNQSSASLKIMYRLERRSEEIPLFSLDLATGYVNGLKNKQSPLIVGAKRVSADLAARLSAHTDPYASIFLAINEGSNMVTAAELVEAIKETRKYAEETLKSVNVPVTDENVTLFLQLLSVKTIRVVKESLAGMPWLKTEKQVDKNLALMVGMGLSYERLLVFNIADDYPKDKDELEVMLSVPHEWMAKAVVI